MAFDKEGAAEVEWTYRMESLPGVLDKILEAIGLSSESRGNVEEMSTKFHKQRIAREAKGKLTFGDILAEDRAIGEFVDFMGKAYGYKETL